MRPVPRQFIIVEARVLPLPHNPSRCRFYDAAVWGSRLPLAKMQSLWSEAANGRWSECPYHSTNWRTVAAAACWVLRRQLRRDPEGWNGQTPSMLAAEYPGRPLADHERNAVGSLLWEPISWDPAEDDSVMNGQHRACALRIAGAPEVPVLQHW